MQKHIKIYLEHTHKLPHELLCEICGSNQAIDIHHIESRRYKDSDNIKNLIALCRKHHTWIHANNTFENKQKLHYLANERLT